MEIRLIEGPLAGQVREIPEEALIQGCAVFFQVSSDGSCVFVEDPAPRTSGLVEYLYKGDRRARYVGGLPAKPDPASGAVPRG